jgi:hypothetical protein
MAKKNTLDTTQKSVANDVKPSEVVPATKAVKGKKNR